MPYKIEGQVFFPIKQNLTRNKDANKIPEGKA